MYRYSIILIIFFISGCASPEGSNWIHSDFNKYDKNYSPFETSFLKIGMDKNSVVNKLGLDFRTVEVTKDYEVISYQKWKSVNGPDYVEETLYLKFENAFLASWKIVNDTTEIVPRSW
mgnify:CR=1 FL=1